jgi:hypothetical protein
MKATLILAALVLAGCSTASAPPPASTPHVTFAGGNGTSCDDLVVVKAANESEGVDAEYEWIDRHFPGATRGGQSLGRCSQTAVDIITITTASGEERKIYFDISAFFGKS